MHTRRDFVSTSGSALGGVWLTRLLPAAALMQACARDAALTGTFVTFSATEAADFDALAARMVPSDDTPGAREAGSVYFADQALADPMAPFLPLIRAGLEDMAARIPDGATAGSFAELTEAEQDEIIGAIEQENPPFFFFARTLVVLGLVTNPEYGGNRDKIGWELIGFEDTYGYAPPFGHYDRNEHGSSGAGEDR